MGRLISKGQHSRGDEIFSKAKCHYIGRFFIAILTIGIYTKQSLAIDTDKFVHASARNAVIKVTVVGKTLGNDKSPPEQAAGVATAFFISKEGYALTAAHLFFKDDGYNDPTKRLYPISGVEFVTGRIGSASVPSRIFSLEEISPTHDVALIKLLDSQGEAQKTFPVCSGFESRQERLTAVGFTVTKGLLTPGGNILQDLDGDVYPTDIAFNPGMSGSPVLDVRGQVIALAVDGLRGSNIQGLNRMLAAQFFKTQLGSAKVTEDCNATLDLGEIEEKSAKYDQIIREAKEEPNLSASRDKYDDAYKLNPKGWEALYGLAHIDFENGNFDSASQFASKSFAAKYPSDYSLLNFAALADDGAGNLGSAINAYKRIVTNNERNKSLYKDALFSLGQVEIKLFIKNGSRSNDHDLVANAKENFNSFLRIGGAPTHFALYHLACINALEGDDKQAQAIFNRAQQAIKKYRGVNRDIHMRLFQSSLIASDELRPGDPVICPPLQKIVRASNK